MCLVYLYYAAILQKFNMLLVIAFMSLAIEGFVVYVVNKGDCPLGYLHEKVGDKKPFFELFFPVKFAQNAFKIFSIITWGGVFLLMVRILMIVL